MIQDAINCWRLDPTNEIGFYNFSTNWCRHVFEILILLRGIRQGEDFTHREEEERRQERKKRRCWKSFRNSCKIYIPLPRETTVSSKVFEHSETTRWKKLIKTRAGKLWKRISFHWNIGFPFVENTILFSSSSSFCRRFDRGRDRRL